MRGTGSAQERLGPTPGATAAHGEGEQAGGEERRPITNDALIEEINSAYRRLKAATEDLASADRELAKHIRRVRLDNAEAILEAKNERTASLYLDGLLDTDEHRRLEGIRARADLDLQHARREVDRFHLIVRLLGTQASEGIGR
jgi:hypothetical protein